MGVCCLRGDRGARVWGGGARGEVHAGTPAVPCTEQKGTKTVPPPHFLTLCLPPRFICERGSPRGTGTTAVTHGQPGGDTAAEGQWLRTPGGNQAGPARPPPPRLLLLLQAPDKEAAPGRAPRSGGLVLPLLLLPLFLNPSYKTMRRAPAPQPPHRSWRAGGTAPGFAAPPRAGQGSRVGLGRAAFSQTPPLDPASAVGWGARGSGVAGAAPVLAPRFVDIKCFGGSGVGVSGSV